jgi:hypothetical protein
VFYYVYGSFCLSHAEAKFSLPPAFFLLAFTATYRYIPFPELKFQTSPKYNTSMQLTKGSRIWLQMAMTVALYAWLIGWHCPTFEVVMFTTLLK